MHNAPVNVKPQGGGGGGGGGAGRQRFRFLAQTRRIVGSGDENENVKFRRFLFFESA